jgi:flagellar assembly protein FliH
MSSSFNSRPGSNRITAEELVGASVHRFDALGTPPGATGMPRAPAREAPIKAKAPPKPAEALAAALEQKYQAGLLAGHANGYAQGMAEANARIDAMRSEFSALALSMHNEAGKLEDDVAVRVIGLVRSLARQVIRAELESRPEAITAVVDECLGLVSESVGRIVIHMNPADLALVGEEVAGRDDRIQLHPDANLTRGGCRFVTTHGEIDASLEQRIDRALDVLTPGGGAAGNAGNHAGA